MPIEVAEFALCRELGCTKSQLDAEPSWWVEMALQLMSEEAKAAERERNKKTKK